jgi:hypothetical protein
MNANQVIDFGGMTLFPVREVDNSVRTFPLGCFLIDLVTRKVMSRANGLRLSNVDIGW